MDAPYDQHIVFFLDFADRLGAEATFARRNFARLQRAAKGAGQSTGGGGHQVVERGGVRVRLGGANAVLGGDLRMDAKENWFCFRRQIGPAEWTFDTLDAHVGTVDDGIAHGVPSFLLILFQRWPPVRIEAGCAFHFPAFCAKCV
jgi:hypothetical protein